MTIQEPITLVVIHDDVPRTANGNVKVRMVAQMYTNGQAVEAVANHYGITLADVHAALAYYYGNRAYFEAIEQRNAALREQYGVSADEHRQQMRTQKPRDGRGSA